MALPFFPSRFLHLVPPPPTHRQNQPFLPSIFSVKIPSLSSSTLVIKSQQPSSKMSFGLDLSLKIAQRCGKKADIIKVGPWGGNSGGSWTFNPDGMFRITEIWIASGDKVDSIIFVYQDQDLNIYHSPRYGGDSGTIQKIIFKEDEEIYKMSGTTRDHVLSLSFQTNKGNTFGPYGSVEGTSFSLPVTKGKFVGFFGNSGNFLDSIGAILQF